MHKISSTSRPPLLSLQGSLINTMPFTKQILTQLVMGQWATFQASTVELSCTGWNLRAEGPVAQAQAPVIAGPSLRRIQLSYIGGNGWRGWDKKGWKLAKYMVKRCGEGQGGGGSACFHAATMPLPEQSHILSLQGGGARTPRALAAPAPSPGTFTHAHGCRPFCWKLMDHVLRFIAILALFVIDIPVSFLLLLSLLLCFL
jgi:hypothetical protein